MPGMIVCSYMRWPIDRQFWGAGMFGKMLVIGIFPKDNPQILYHTTVISYPLFITKRRGQYDLIFMSRLSRQSRTLLVTLDAFGTLYRPRKGIAIQYLEVAKSCGLHIEATIEDFNQSFKQAFQSQYSRSPNYGKATGMNPETWWADVVNETFRPLVTAVERIPESLPGSLFHHFSSKKGYELYPDTMPFFQQMKQWKQNLTPDLGINNVVVGVVTNSDPRVVHVLQSFGLTIGQSRKEGIQNDVDFVSTSYETGHEKPNPAAFAKAEQRARNVLGLPQIRGQSSDDVVSDAIKVHIGDHLHKDYWAAIRSGRGWDAILLDRNANEAESPYHDVRYATRLEETQAVLMSLLQRSQR